jgi:hypothetical protein
VAQNFGSTFAGDRAREAAERGRRVVLSWDREQMRRLDASAQ